MRTYYLSDLMYKGPNQGIFDDQKKEFFCSFYDQLTEDTIVNRWKHLGFMFRNIQLFEKKNEAAFITFVQRRTMIEEGRYKVSLSDFLSFMESFYFLLNTTNPAFMLSTERKRELLNSLTDIYYQRICEPGICTRLNDLLIDYRGDKDWIGIELHRQRKNFLRLMADSYNAKNSVGEGYSVHTVLHMQTLAAQANLGINLESNVSDVYLDVTSTRKMVAYFNANLQERKASYEKTCIDGLLTYIWSEFRAKFPGKSLPLIFWDENYNVTDDYQTFSDFISYYFGDDFEINSFLAEDNSESRDEDTLKSAFREAIIKKMVDQGYLIKHENLTAENCASVLGFSQHLSLVQEILNSKMSLDDKTFRKHTHFFNKFPNFLSNLILENPQLWQQLPQSLKTDKLVELLMRALDQEKLHSELRLHILDDYPEYQIRDESAIPLARCLGDARLKKSYFYYSQYDYNIMPSQLLRVSGLSDISKSAVKRFDLALRKIDPRYQENIKSQGFIKWRESQENLNLNNDSDKALVFAMIRENTTLLKAIHAFQAKIIVYDLVFKGNESFLHQFYLSLEHLKVVCKCLLAITKQCLEFSLWVLAWFGISYLDDVIYMFSNFIVANPYLLCLFLVLELAMLGREIWMNKFEVIHLIDVLILILAPIIPEIMVWYVIIFRLFKELLPCLIFIPGQFLARPLSIGDAREIVGTWLNIYLYIDIKLLSVFILGGINIVINCFQALIGLNNSIIPWFARGIFTLTEKFSVETPLDKFCLNIENTISGLMIKDEVLAQAKARILKNIWFYIQADIVTSGSDVNKDYTPLLTKKYPISLQGQEHEVSFNEVMSSMSEKDQGLAPATSSRLSLFPSRENSSLVLLEPSPGLQA